MFPPDKLIFHSFSTSRSEGPCCRVSDSPISRHLAEALLRANPLQELVSEAQRFSCLLLRTTCFCRPSATTKPAGPRCPL